MTARTHQSGTDRISEAVKTLNLSADAIVVNIQGDQPIFEPVQVDEVIQPLIDDPAIVMSTLIYKIILEEEITHPHAVKVVLDHQNFALYFSRAKIPYVRGGKLKADYYKIKVVITPHDSVEVDNQQELERVRQIMQLG